jgi:hypothetical protein
MEAWDIDIPFTPAENEGHKAITQNFINAILNNDPLIASGLDGFKQLELGNSILMAALTRKSVELPLNADAYDQFIAEMTKTYGGRKTLKTDPNASVDMAASFKR